MAEAEVVHEDIEAETAEDLSAALTQLKLPASAVNAIVELSCQVILVANRCVEKNKLGAHIKGINIVKNTRKPRYFTVELDFGDNVKLCDVEAVSNHVTNMVNASQDIATGPTKLRRSLEAGE